MATPTMELITVATATDAESSLTISSLPQTYKNLYIEIIVELGKFPTIYKNSDQDFADYEWSYFYGLGKAFNNDEAYIRLSAETTTTYAKWFTGEITNYAQSTQSIGISGYTGSKDRSHVNVALVRSNVAAGAITSLTFDSVDATFGGDVKVVLYGLVG